MIELKKIIDQMEITILNTELYSVGKKWNYKNVINPYSRIYYITDGCAFLKMHGETYGLKPGWLYLIPCFISVDMSCPKWFRQYYIHFTSRIHTGLDILSVFKCDYQAKAAKHNIDRKLLDRLIELNPNRQLLEYDATKPIYKDVLERSTQFDKQKNASQLLESDAIMRLLLSAFFENCDTSQISDTIAGLSRFNNVIEYIRTHLAQPITLNTLADIAGINPTYFSNLFSKQMGISPIQYLNKTRIEKAQTLLLATTDNLDTIAQLIGFTDTFYFSRMFKKITGISPGLYRKQQIQT